VVEREQTKGDRGQATRAELCGVGCVLLDVWALVEQEVGKRMWG